MELLVKILVCFLAGAGAGIGTGFAGMSAAAVIGPMLMTFLGYEMHMAVGTSVFIMAFTALTGGISHFAIGGMPDVTCLILCVVFTLLWAKIAAAIANRASAVTLNRVVGIVMILTSIVILLVNYVF
ncbi:TSUP family transporter [Hominenteromicrobium sp.]|uniref:TSUP family transporter n=1 Tax=Hominenteromicrobium sp. TaxID=3073581 RepID=UPI003A954E26